MFAKRTDGISYHVSKAYRFSAVVFGVVVAWLVEEAGQALKAPNRG